MILFLDTETRGDRFDDGPYIYSTLGKAEPILVQWAVNNGPVCVREWGDLQDPQLQMLVDQASTVVLHNAEFDRTVLKAAGIDIPLHKIHCTMAQARRHGLPGGLEILCQVFEVEDGKRKLANGKALIQIFCKRNSDGGWNDKHTHPVEWAEFKQYAKYDVISMRELYEKIPHWNDEYEQPVWIADAMMNQTGFQVDGELAECAIKVLSKVKKASDQAIAEATGFEVTSITQVAALKAVLAQHGVDLPDMNASTLERRVNDDDLPVHVRQLIRLRLEGAKTSTAKYRALLRTRGRDGRIRGAKVYCGAARTGRFSGKIIQPDNFPRPSIAPQELWTDIAAVKTGRLPILSDLPLPHFFSQTLRGTIVSEPYNKLVVADYANIEGRVGAWVTGELWKLEAFRAYDRKQGPDLYKLSFARAFDRKVDTVTKQERQLGKVFELMLQYGGGVAAFLTGCETYRVPPEALLAAIPSVDAALWERSESVRTWFIEDLGDKLAATLEPRLWRICWCLTRMWRDDNSAIKAYWKELEDTIDLALENEGNVFRCGKVLVDRLGEWTRIQLPSGRYLCYFRMERDKKGLRFQGINPYNHRWSWVRTWGGTLFENICQGIARDVLVEGMIQVMCSGGCPILHIHDELIIEALNDHHTTPEWLVDRMCRFSPRHWTEGLPIAASGFETQRYYKEV